MRTPILLLTISTLACAKAETPTPAAPSAPPPATPAPAAPEAPAAAAEKQETLAVLLGAVAKIDVEERSLGAAGATAGKKYAIADAAKIQAALSAVGLEQVADGAQRRCPDTLVLHLVDAAGAEKGAIGLCNTTALTEASALEGPEFFQGSTRGGIKLADEGALKKLLLEAAGTPAS